MIDTRLAERADLLAYLERRKANCLLVAAKSPEFADAAKVQARQLSILIDEIRGGLHECGAEVAQALAMVSAEQEGITAFRLKLRRWKCRLRLVLMLTTGRI